MKYLVLTAGILVSIGVAFVADAQELHNDLQGVWRARVVEVVEQYTEILPGTDTEVIIQNLRIELLEGDRKGEFLEIVNDYMPLDEGDRFFLNYLVTIQGDEIYSVRDVDRRLSLFIFTLIFAAVIVLFGGWQGVRSLVSLVGSLVAIVYVLVPLLLAGYSPVLVSVLVAALVLFAAIFFTHGFNRESAVAFTGTMMAVLITGILAYIAVKASALSGFSSDESVYLNLSTAGTLNFSGLLLGGIIIGVLGVLDDIAVTQAAIVSELKNSGADLFRWEIYKRAVRVGKEHVGALVNTLALAYAGASLPLLLLFSFSASAPGVILNQEVFATEIIRTIVGSIGLVLTVPITTALAVMVLTPRPGKTVSGAHSHHH